MSPSPSIDNALLTLRITELTECRLEMRRAVQRGDGARLRAADARVQRSLRRARGLDLDGCDAAILDECASLFARFASQVDPFSTTRKLRVLAEALDLLQELAMEEAHSATRPFWELGAAG